MVDTLLAQSHLQALRLLAKRELDPELPARANNIARTRSSKGRSHAHQTSYLLLKAIGPGVTWHRGDGVLLDISGNTNIAGASAIAIVPTDGWTTLEPIWLVENQALFERLDWLPSGAHGSVVYYGGQLSNVLLDSMAQRERTGRIILFPDDDGVGLLNYTRLVEKSLSSIQFWLMPGWLELLQKYGNNDLWQKTQREFNAALHRLQQKGMPPELGALCHALALHGLALEHESVWLAA